MSKQKGHVRVLAFGTFDILHPGHDHYLQEARKLGDELWVVVALDETVRQVKGRLPKYSQEQRRKAGEGLLFVDHAVLGNPGDKYRIVEEINPDIIAIGYDQTSFVDNLAALLTLRGLNPRIVKIGSHLPEKYKSSKMR